MICGLLKKEDNHRVGGSCTENTELGKELEISPSVSLLGALLQTKSCVPCGKKIENHSGILFINYHRGHRGTQSQKN